MKAARLLQYGEKETIVINDIPKPAMAHDKILVEIYSAGVNPIDWKIQSGFMKDMMPLQLPVTLGGDFSGVVVAVGRNVADFTVGDAVYGFASVLAGGSGSFAEFALVSPKRIARKPANSNFTQAGSLPLAGISAVQALLEHIKIQKGQHILIHGGAGGIGSIAIQIAKHIGARVATTVSTNDTAYVQKLGADEIIDYKNQKFEDILSNIDAVFDTVGGETTIRSLQVIKTGGILVSMVQSIGETLAKNKNITTILQQSHVTTDHLKKLSEFVEDGIVTVYVEKTFPLEKTEEALTYLHHSPPQGKVVLQIK